MKIKDLNDIMLKQAGCIANMFEDLEKIHIPPAWGKYRKDENLTKESDYKYMGLRALWVEFLKKQGAINANDVKILLPKIMPLFIVQVQNMAKKRKDAEPSLDEEKEEKDFRESVKKMQIAVDAMIASPWINPFATWRE